MSDSPETTDLPQPRAAVKWAAYVAIPLVLAVLVALGGEAAVRIRQWWRIGTASSFTDLYRVDERIGLRVLVPGARVGHISINGAGFRGPEIPTTRNPRALRIAFLGASTTFCAEVSGDAMVWPQLVADDLGKRFAGVPVDFVNGGVPGYTVASSRKNLQHRVAAFKPDVIVVYHATNDLSGEVRERAEAQGLIQAAQDLQPGWLERHSLLWELVQKNLRVMAAQRAPQSTTAAASKLLVDANTLGARFREELGLLLREAKATGAHVAVATFSTHLRRGQSTEAARRAAVSAFVYMPFMTIEGLLDGYERYNRLIAEAAAAEGVTLIAGEDSIPGDPTHFVDSVHFSDAGSQKMARRVADVLAADPAVAALLAQRR